MHYDLTKELERPILKSDDISGELDGISELLQKATDKALLSRVSQYMRNPKKLLALSGAEQMKVFRGLSGGKVNEKLFKRMVRVALQSDDPKVQRWAQQMHSVNQQEKRSKKVRKFTGPYEGY